MPSDSSCDEEDSDLEILVLPNSKSIAPLVDLSQNDENDIHSMTINDFVYPEHYHNNSNHSSKKRAIKLEDDKTPPTKKRRLLENDLSARIPKTESMSGALDKSLDVSQYQTKQFAGKSKYHFLTKKDGLDYVGQCLNKNCIAYQERILSPKGYGMIKPIEDIKSKAIKCPGCSQSFELKGIYLSCCSAIIKYKFVGDTRIKIKNIENIASGEYVAFGESSQSTPYPNVRNPTHYKHTATSNSHKNVYEALEFDVRKCRDPSSAYY